MFSRLACLIALTLIPFHVAHADDKEKKCEPQQFLGTYQIISGEKDGAKLPEDRLQQVKAIIRKDSILTYDKGENEIYVASYSLTPDKDACHLSMKSIRPPKQGGVSASGLIKLEGDKVYLIYALPDGEQPTEFKTKEKQHMFIMRKTSDDTGESDQ
ncbi:TIGR03067 domain-containing protein [Planctomicrobium sp. SH661]|uniref:TIGR03067 domain-containing protein n=1 Tax=Planctomicrobium sp. SH661 TaxID=3448124 RepID=UPI003F5B594A